MAEGGALPEITVVSPEPEVSLEATANQQAENKEKANGQKQLEVEDTIVYSSTSKDKIDVASFGLGKAIDATNPHPWESKSPYQAKKVKANITVTNEGNHARKYSELVENYFEVQGGIDASLKVPNKPIEIGVAADASRSSRYRKLVQGETIQTQRVSFKLFTESEEYQSIFERDLLKWVEVQAKDIQAKDVRGKDAQDEDAQGKDAQDEDAQGKDAQGKDKDVQAKDVPVEQWMKDNKEGELPNVCEQFLRRLGGATHYVSSVTFGAMKYAQTKISSQETTTSVSTSVGVERLGNSKVKVSTRKLSRLSSKHTEMIGRFDPDGKVVQDEAVIHYAFTPLANLVKNPDLMYGVMKAVEIYCNEQLSRQSGPYYIASIELMNGKPLYWKVQHEPHQAGGRRRPEKFTIVCTHNAKKASKFNIELDWFHSGKFFYITTIDNGSGDGKDDPDGLFRHSPRRSGPHVQHTCGLVKHPDVKRYVHTKLSGYVPYKIGGASTKLRAYAMVEADSVYKTARFQVVDHQAHKKRSLQMSDWLPEKGRLDHSEPCFIRPRFHSHCLAITRQRTMPLAAPSEPEVGFRICKMSNHREGTCHMLFTLLPVAAISNGSNGDRSASSMAK